MFFCAERKFSATSTRCRAKTKTYNSGDSLVVTHLTTNPPVPCLSTAERTGSSVLKVLWSYVKELVLTPYIFQSEQVIHISKVNIHTSRFVLVGSQEASLYTKRARVCARQNSICTTDKSVLDQTSNDDDNEMRASDSC